MHLCIIHGPTNMYITEGLCTYPSACLKHHEIFLQWPHNCKKSKFDQLNGHALVIHISSRNKILTISPAWNTTMLKHKFFEKFNQQAIKYTLAFNKSLCCHIFFVSGFFEGLQKVIELPTLLSAFFSFAGPPLYHNWFRQF